MRTLPLRVQPVAGEALDSWLEALATRMQCSWGDLLTAVDLPAGRTRSCTTGWLASLTDQQLQSLSFATHQSREVISAMVLSHITDALGHCPDIPRRSVESMLWLDRRRSRFCPDCLAQTSGRWSLAWRLRWSFACVRHARLLADTCPSCQAPQRAVPFAVALIPIPGLCANKLSGVHGRDVTRCGADISSAPVLSLDQEHPILEAQRTIDAAVRTGFMRGGIYSRAPVPLSALIADLSALGGRILRYPNFEKLADLTSDAAITELLHREAGELSARGVTADSLAVASAVAAASSASILNSANLTEAGDRLRWLIADCRSAGLSVSASNIGWGRGISPALRSAQLQALSEFLSPSDRLRYRTHSMTTRHPPSRQANERARRLPPLLWPATCMHVRCEGAGFTPVRSALAVAVLLVGSRLTLSAAAALLGSVTSARAVSRILQLIGRSGSAAKVWSMIEDLADQLDAQRPPIDYARRRALAWEGFLPQSVWMQICLSSGVSPGRGLRLAIARCWLYERITGFPGSRSPWSPKTPEFRSKLADLPEMLNSDFISAADCYARLFLNNQGITGEPIVWSPIALRRSELADIGGRDNGRRAEIAVSRCLRESELDLGSVPRDVRGGVFTAAEVLPQHLLEVLYLDQRQSLAGIASRYGLSRQMVTRLARSYGVRLRPPGRAQRD